MTYEGFAYLYDDLMRDVPYEEWVKHVLAMSQKYGVEGKKLLDLACGTGELSVRFSNAGFTVTGVDLSEDMLTVAQAKANLAGENIDFLLQDMSELELIDRYDIIGIFCDSLNYLQSEEEVQRTFQHVKRYLNHNGLFLFDVHSLFKINHVFMDQTFTYDDDHICYIWNCFEGDTSNSVDHELTFFIEDGSGKYDRVDENHSQRTFPVSTYLKWLDEAGFDVLQVLGEDLTKEPTPECERIFFVARQKN